jgi:hypothetical protein
VKINYARFQGYPIDRHKLGVFVLSGGDNGTAGALLGFQTYLVSAEAVSVPFSGERAGDGRDRRHASCFRAGVGALSLLSFANCSQYGRPIGCCGSGLVFVGRVLAERIG